MGKTFRPPIRRLYTTSTLSHRALVNDHPVRTELIAELAEAEHEKCLSHLHKYFAAIRDRVASSDGS